MQNVEILSSKFSVPDKWNELNVKQSIEVARLLFAKNLKLTKQQWNYAVLYCLLNFKWYKPLAVYRFLQVPKTLVVMGMFPLTEFITKENKLTDFKMKRFRVGFTYFYAPADDLKNLTIDEFRFTDPLYINYKKTKNIDFLDALVAVLYRPKRKDYNPSSPEFNGDVREDFNEHLTVKYAKKVAKLSEHKKHLIYLAYEGARNQIITDCPNLFNSSEKIKQGRDFGLSGLILELAGGKFGTFPETCKTSVTTALNLLEMEAQKILNRKK